jgi:hypothetical protein
MRVEVNQANEQFSHRGIWDHRCLSELATCLPRPFVSKTNLYINNSDNHRTIKKQRVKTVFIKKILILYSKLYTLMKLNTQIWSSMQGCKNNMLMVQISQEIIQNA